MKITFIGTGYVGLVSGVMMSHLGHSITCIDVDQTKISSLKAKKVPIFEPGLDEYVEKYANSNRLNFTNSYGSSLGDSECVFITVGTPQKDDGSADISSIFTAVEEVCKYISSECLLVIKSTVPPGTCAEVQNFVISKGYKNEVVSNPEFLREGSAIIDFMKPDRIVIGASSTRALDIMRKLYKPLIDNGVGIVETDLGTSELIKYAANAFLANKIAFINEMADLCEIVGADITKISEGIGLDKRIGKSFLNPGPGFGGSCFPKDILALQNLAKKVKSNFLVLDAVIKANSNRPANILQKIKTAVGNNLNGKKLAILGLTYKAGTDDLRSSPAIELINKLKESGADIIAYDPEGMINAHKYFQDLKCASSPIEAVRDTDAIIIVTEWDEFKLIDFAKAKSIMATPVIIDLRNILNYQQLKATGFRYYSIGRKSDE
ncbi:MAG: UDP-glucose/GDP-mannose dehydrogenase family protein [Rickettsiaceae bacterium]